MFDRICRHYDLFNRISSFGLDKSWRQKLALALKDEKELRVLDIACGTGDVLLSLFKNGCDISKAAGIDISAKMLEIAKGKLSGYKTDLKVCDVADISFPDNEFDVVTCAFGIRNFSDLQAGLNEMFRVLKPAGKLLILEFSIPQNCLLRALFLFYIKYIIPVLGKILTGDFQPYHYLSSTIRTFPSGEKFCQILQSTSFAEIKMQRFTFGAVTLYSAIKP